VFLQTVMWILLLDRTVDTSEPSSLTVKPVAAAGNLLHLTQTYS